MKFIFGIEFAAKYMIIWYDKAKFNPVIMAFTHTIQTMYQAFLQELKIGFWLIQHKTSK